MSLERGHMLFTPWNYLIYAEEIKFVRNAKISWGGTLLNSVEHLSTIKKFQKSNIILEGSRHLNFMNPFEYGKSLIGKSFPKRFGTLTPPNPKLFWGGTMCLPPSLVFRYGQIGWLIDRVKSALVWYRIYEQKYYVVVFNLCWLREFLNRQKWYHHHYYHHHHHHNSHQHQWHSSWLNNIASHAPRLHCPFIQLLCAVPMNIFLILNSCIFLTQLTLQL